MISADAAMAGSYDCHTAALSVLMAIAASYAALDLAGRVTAASGWVRSAWLISGAGAMGLGIWSMHFCFRLGRARQAGRLANIGGRPNFQIVVSGRYMPRVGSEPL